MFTTAEMGEPLRLAFMTGRRSSVNVSGTVASSPISQPAGSDCAIAGLELIRAASKSGPARRAYEVENRWVIVINNEPKKDTV